MLFSGTIHPTLAHEIAEQPRHPVEPGRAPPVRLGRDLLPRRGVRARRRRFIVQTHYEPVNEAIMEQLIMIDAMKRASAKRITAVVPVLRLLAAGQEDAVARADHGQAHGRPDDRGRRRPDRVGRPALRPDPGVLRRAVRPPDGAADPLELPGEQARLARGRCDRVARRRSASRPPRSCASTSTRTWRSSTSGGRKEAHKIEEMAVVGEVEGRPCVVVDDMIDTAGTVAKGVEALGRRAPARSTPAATHAIFSGKAGKPGGGADPARSSSRTPCRSPRRSSSRSCRYCRSPR